MRLLYALSLFVVGGEISGFLLVVSGVAKGNVEMEPGWLLEGEERGLVGEDMSVSGAREGTLVLRVESGDGELRSGEEERGDG